MRDDTSTIPAPRTIVLGLWALLFCMLIVPEPVLAVTNESISCTVSIVFSPDTDGDGLTDANEDWLGTDPLKKDTDGDDMPDGWEITQKFDPTNGADGLLDADGDGANNAHEYVAGTDPHEADSVLRITGIEAAPPSNDVVVVWSSVTGRVYDIESVTNILSPLWLNMESNIPGSVSGQYVWTGKPLLQEDSFFYRVRVRKEE